jgi:hypothetical protein
MTVTRRLVLVWLTLGTLAGLALTDWASGAEGLPLAGMALGAGFGWALARHRRSRSRKAWGRD